MEKEEQMRKAQLLSIIEWLRTTDEFKKVEWTNEASIFYHVAPNTYAELILKYKQDLNKKVIETLDDMDSIMIQLEDVLHGSEGKNITSLRHGIIEIKNIIR